MRPIPDRTIVAQLKRIDKELDVQFVDPPGRWAVYHSLPNFGDTVEHVVDLLAREIQLHQATCGRIVDFPTCQTEAFEAIQRSKLVCYVTEDDGSYRPLDGRLVEKLQRMDYWRKNLGIAGWRQMLMAKAAAAQAIRQKAADAFWDDVRRDKAYHRLLSDLLWETTPVRSVIVPANVPRALRA